MKKLIILAILFLPLVLTAGQQGQLTVERVIDGDTIVILRPEHIRFLGINTPELHGKEPQCMAIEAREYVEKALAGGTVHLTYEEPLKDVFGRTLAWVWIGDRLLNADLVREGYAYSYRKYPTSRLEELNRLEAEAKAAKRGMWSEKCQL